MRPGGGASSAALDARRRSAELDRLADGEPVDVVVVGGGVTGAGVALDAAARGLSVALLERTDLAVGTSRWSSKLVHGGLRYLSKGQVGIAWESARERAVLIDRTAPHLVRPLPMLVPFCATVQRGEDRVLSAGIRAGDVLRRTSGTRNWRLPAARRVSGEEARRWAPALSSDGLRGALLHWDGQLEDDARLVVALARTAASYGARILTHVSVLEPVEGGVRARDELTGTELVVRARNVVNAAGVWAGALDDRVRLRPSKGAHLLLDAARLGDPRAAISVPVPGALGRFVFALPRPDGQVLVGLTDDPYDGELLEEPPVDASEETFLLDVLGAALERPLTSDDVIGRFAGLRPLLDGVADGGPAADEDVPGTADLSRRHAVLEHPDTGVVSIVGGKLTTYRRMAQDAVDHVVARPGVRAGASTTVRIPLVGAGPVDKELPPRLVRRFGAEAAAVAALADGRPELLRPIAPGVPVFGVELVWAAEAELAITAEDVRRRVRADLLPAWRPVVDAAARDLVPA